MYENTGKVVENKDAEGFVEPTDNEKEIIEFVVDHTDRWRDYRDQNFLDNWEKYERVYTMKWDAEDKQRDSERSRVISPATHQAVQTRHTEIMEAIFGQGEYFDIKDDVSDENGTPLDVEQLKKNLYEDFAQDKIVKSISQIELMAEIYGTGIGEIVVGKDKKLVPKTIPIPNTDQVAYGVVEEDRYYVRLVPVNPKNFLFDPNGSTIDECMGVAIERHISAHKIMEGINSGKYRKVDIDTLYENDALEPTQEIKNYKDDKVKILTYYGLVPKEYLDSLKDKEEDQVEELFSESVEDYVDMVEAIVVIANGSLLLKAEETPYMMKDRPVISYQNDIVPNRLLGFGTIEKSFNMQSSIDGSMRAHQDSLALTSSPMVAIDATRLPRGSKFEVKPGKAILFNGDPASAIMPFKFGTTDGSSMETSKEFERMLLMAAGTLDTQGLVSAATRDGGDNMSIAASGIIKRYKRVLVNFQEDFLIPFIYKAAYRYMQFAPERYPSVDVKFVPTASLGIVAREYEQKQLAFLIQTLGADNKITPILMKGILKNSSLNNREELIAEMEKASQPDPQQQQLQMAAAQADLQLKASMANESQAKANMNNALAQLDTVKAQLHPQQVQAEITAAASKNLPSEEDLMQAEFERRIKMGELMLKEKDIETNKEIVAMQMAAKQAEQENKARFMQEAANGS